MAKNTQDARTGSPPPVVSELCEALRWALDQLEDDLDFDHRAAMKAARETLDRALQEVHE
jgi:hypothetical protein